jgi:hypothetical protein
LCVEPAEPFWQFGKSSQQVWRQHDGRDDGVAVAQTEAASTGHSVFWAFPVFVIVRLCSSGFAMAPMMYVCGGKCAAVLSLSCSPWAQLQAGVILSVKLSLH